MKKFLKSIALMLLAGAFVLGFASCSNDSSDSSNTNSSSSSSSSSGSGNSGSGSSGSNENVSATYKYESGGTVIKFILYNDATLTQWDSRAVTVIPDGLTMKGTYEKTGDKFSDCEITFKKTHGRNADGSWIPQSSSWSRTVSGGKFTNEGKDFVLQN